LRTALLLATLVLFAAAGWWSLDGLALDLVHERIGQAGLGGRLAFGRLESDLPRRVSVFDTVMRDAPDGQDVLQLERLDFMLDVNWDSEPKMLLTSVDGKGGRISIVPTADGLGAMVETLAETITAISALVRELSDEKTPKREAGGMPPLLFRDIDLVLRSDSWPVQHFPGTSVRVSRGSAGVDAVIDLGSGGGRLVLGFGDEGLHRLEAVDLVLTPAIVRLIGEPWGPLFARLLRPRARADLVIIASGEGLPELHGTLREAVIDSPRIPFTLGPLTIPLEFKDGRLSVRIEPTAFESGTLEVTVLGTEDDLDLAFRVRAASFQEAFLELLPVYRGQEFVAAHDGGRFDLDLALHWNFKLNPVPVVSGGGGFHVQMVDLPVFHIAVSDVVGRFEVSDEELKVPELSGQCAGGSFNGSATLDLVDNRFAVKLSLAEMELADLRASIAPEVAEEHPITGTVAGWLRCEGDVDRFELTRGRGEFTIRAGRFAESRLLTRIREALTLGPAEQRNDQRLKAEIKLWDGILTFDRVIVDLGLLALTGQGQLNREGALKLDLLLMDGPGGLLGELWGLIQRGLLVQVQLTGSLDRPEVAVYPLGVISRPLEKVIDFLRDWRERDA